MKEGWMKNDEWWRVNDEGWWFQAVEGFCRQTNRQTNERTDICDCRVAFSTENIKYVFFFQKIDICTNNSTLFYISETLGRYAALLDNMQLS